MEPIEPRVLLHGLHHDTHPAPGDEPLTPMPPVVIGPTSPVASEVAPSPAAVGDQMLPDVFPLISQSSNYVYGWSLDENEIPGRTLLRLTTAMANAGRGAMELRGSTINGDGTQNVLQRIYLEGGGFDDRLAGTFSYHPGHGHIHFDGFAAYHLRQVTPGNGVGSIVASGDKVSFCLLDIDRYNPSLPGSPASSAYNSCGQVQGVSVGWADVYDKSLDDQWIDVTGMADGQYWLEVVSDPDNRMTESNETNNTDRILIDLDLPARDPFVVAHQPVGQSLHPASSIDFVFKERINTASFNPADDIVSFTGPGGVDLSGQVTGFSWFDGDTRLRVSFNTQAAYGAYAMTIGPQILAFDNDNPMDQDSDDVPGEAVADRYTATFSLAPFIGPEGFGYRASATPVQSIDLAAGAPGVFNILTNSDDSSAGVSLGANTFNFYGTSYGGAGQLFVSSNGLITFGSGNAALENLDLTTGPSQRAIAPLWDDWRTDLNGADAVLGKFDDANGDGSVDRLIIEWSDVQHFSSSPSPVTFQAILQLNTGSTPGYMIFNYPDVDTADNTANAAAATVGIKDAGNQGARRLLVSHNDGNGPVACGRAIRIEVDTVAPTVGEVFVNGTAWSTAFRNFIGTSGAGDATFGYRLNAANHVNELPWVNVNQVSVRFNENVNVAADDLVVRGVNIANYSGLMFAYDASTFTATWTLPAGAAFDRDKVLLDLDGGGAGGVTDTNGNALDGEWANPTAPIEGGVDTFPSGDGTAGGDFHFRLNVLPGDVNGSGTILGTDVTLVRNAQGSAPGTGLYTIFKDVNGSASILGTDVTLVRNRQGLTLPAGEPTAPAPETLTSSALRTTSAPRLFATSASTRSAMRLLAQRFDLLGDEVEETLFA